VPQFSRSSEFVDLENGLISREIFINKDIYDQEQEQIFARAWLFIGHETQVPNPGDFVLSKMGEESVILTRDMQGGIHVLLNTCRHRGMMVCRYDIGNTKTFYCPFHGWAYSVDGGLVETPGNLLGVPHFETAYHGKLEKSEWGLVHARMYDYKGAIFATWDDSAPAFLDYMGDMRLWLDELFDYRDGREGGAEVLCGIQKWKIPCNWKFIAENFTGDMYHNTSHVSADHANIGPIASQGDRHGFKADYFKNRSLLSFPALGHGVRGCMSDFDMPMPQYGDPVVDDYLRGVWERRSKNFAGKQFRSGNGGNVFPNMAFHCGFPRTIGMAHPTGPMQTEMWRWFLVDRDAPTEVKNTLRRHYLRYSGPAGITEQDDMENWNMAAAASKGIIARRYPYNYQQGMGFVAAAKGVQGGVVTEGMINEENIRSFYRRWTELMGAREWPAPVAPERGNA
jgi:nitrite reductase/ring-hydroxylating ferredoxin subunit